MRKAGWLLIPLLLFTLGHEASAAKKKGRKPGSVTKTLPVASKEAAPVAAKAAEEKKTDAKVAAPIVLRERASEDEARVYTFRVQSYIGLLIARNSGLVFGLNAGIIPNPDSLWYFGVEANYTNPVSGSLFQVLAAAWREFPVHGASRLSVGVGALGGPVFAGPTTGYPTVTYAAFFSAALCKELDELALLRAEFRPGLIEGRFAFLMNFGVSFRFL